MSDFRNTQGHAEYGAVEQFPNQEPQERGKRHREMRNATRPTIGQAMYDRMYDAVVKKDPEEGLIDEIMAIRCQEELAMRSNGQVELYPDEATAKLAVQQYIDGKREELSQELDHPTWGPRFNYRNYKRGKGGLSGRGNSKGGLFRRNKDEDEYANGDQGSMIEPSRQMHKQDRMIAANVEQSRRYHRFTGLYLGSAVVSILIVAAALFVDYNIIKEFWHQAMVNEYMQLPPELANSVTFKSFQVLFATIGIHLVLRHLPRWALAGFTGLLFLMTMGMMLSIGFLYAHNSLPNDNQATLAGRDTSTTAIGDALTSLGLQGDATEASSAASEVVLPAWLEQLAVYDAMGWMIALSAIFLIVASVGALFLLWAEHNIRNFTVAREYRTRQYQTERLRRAESIALQLHAR